MAYIGLARPYVAKLASTSMSEGVATPTYPFINEDGTPILASQLRTRRLYPTRVNTSVQTGVFRYIGDCLPNTAAIGAESLPIPVTPAAGA